MRRPKLSFAILLTVLFVTVFSAAGVSAADDSGQFFIDGIGYEIIAEAENGKSGEVSVVSYGAGGGDFNISKTVSYNGSSYTVTKIAIDSLCFTDAEIISIPETVCEITSTDWEIECFNPVVITFNCPASAIDDMRFFTINSRAAGTMIYAPAEELAVYEKKFGSICSYSIYASDGFERSYKGMFVAAIGDTGAFPKYFESDGLYFEVIDRDGHELKLIDAAVSSSREAIRTGLYSIPGTVKYGITEFTLTTIGSLSLAETYTAIELPETVTTIEKRAVGEYVPALYMSDSITEIPQALFAGENNRSYLSYIKLPNQLAKINSKTFYNCKRLYKVVIPKSVKVIGNYAFGYKTKELYFEGEIPENISKIGKEAKAISLTGNYITSLTLNRAALSVSKTPVYRLKASVDDTSAQYALVWSNTRPYTSKITQAGKYTSGNGHPIIGSGVYIFDVLTGEYAWCRIVE